jgi:nitrogen fixation-related uncharacterized protein
MNTKHILVLVLVVSILVFLLAAYGMWSVSRRQFERRNEFGVEVFRSARHAFWTRSLEDMVRRSAAVSLPLAAVAAAASAVLLSIVQT